MLMPRNLGYLHVKMAGFPPIGGGAGEAGPFNRNSDTCTRGGGERQTDRVEETDR